jgi:hypothetical protein
MAEAKNELKVVSRELAREVNAEVCQIASSMEQLGTLLDSAGVLDRAVGAWFKDLNKIMYGESDVPMRVEEGICGAANELYSRAGLKIPGS